MTIEILGVADRPDLVPIIARWLWEEWGRPKGRTQEQAAARVGGRTSRRGPEQTLMLLEDGAPAATASLVHADLDERPDLTPWLASVFVHPDFRGRGHAAALVRAVERAAAATVDTLWLQTWTAPGLYARLGWEPAGHATDNGIPVIIMRRELAHAVV